ncbi:MAG: TetR/AcrR family transcriptional regulator [Zymomonas sp.]|nr:MAG: TetR/AcrR family transcriptional regulator [Zymomonas sp.]
MTVLSDLDGPLGIDQQFIPRPPGQPTLKPGGCSEHSTARTRQRQRRSIILASIRQLLIDSGHKGVTVRRVAEASGYVVQTVYNLVGPRDHAIVEAISDYTQYVGGLAPLDPEDPAAIIRSIERQGDSVLLSPEFTRQVCQIYFSESRHIFWNYRERQIRSIYSLLVRQKRCGILRKDVDCRSLARDIMHLSASIYIDWSEGTCSDDDLVPRLVSGYSFLLASALSSSFGGLSVMPL